MTPSTTLPAHTLTSPLDTADEHTLRQVLANTQHIQQVIGQAKAVGLEVSQHEARANMHHQFATNATRAIFPDLSQEPAATNGVTKNEPGYRCQLLHHAGPAGHRHTIGA